MIETTHVILLVAALTWMMLVTASMLRAGGVTWPAILISVGNRDDVPSATLATARAERAAKNMLENAVLFGLVMLGALGHGGDGRRIELGANIFFWARVVYFPIYVIGVTWIRTGLWLVSIGGLGLVAYSTL